MDEDAAQEVWPPKGAATSFRPICGPYLDRARVPDALDFYASQGMALKGRGEWRSALCPFHEDSHPSLRIHIGKGAFRCMACGAKGGDVIAFLMKFKGLTFSQAQRTLGARS